MTKLIFSLLLMSATIVGAQENSRWEYIQRYKRIAMDEMQRTGVPASIKLAQGLLESNAGKSTLAREAKNHFGMKCGSEWKGDTYYLKDDDYDENGVLKESCFRVFGSPEESFIAHSEFLRDPNKAYRYGFLFRIEPPTDYKKWAQGLKQAGYATSPTYGDALIGMIDQYQLYKFDIGGNPDAEITLVNDVKMTLAKAGQTPVELAQAYKVKLKCLLAYNEGLKGASQPLKVNERIFLQKKRRFFRGRQDDHVVRPGESMYSISQLYGLRLKSLLRKNKMSSGQEAAYGEVINLRGFGFWKKTPKLREASFEPSTPSNPFDEGTGKNPHIDETNSVDPSDLKKEGNKTDTNTNTKNNGKNKNGSSTGNSSTNTTNTGKPNTNGTNTGNTSENTTNPSTNGQNTNNNDGNSNNTNSNSSNTNNGNVNNTTDGQNTSNTNDGTVINNNGTSGENNGNSNGSTTNNQPKPTTPTKPTPKPTTPTKPTTTPAKPTTTTPTTKPEVKVVPENQGGTKVNPTKPTTGGTTTPTTPPSVPAGTKFHTVEKGETLYSISKRYGLTVDALMKLNDLKNNTLSLGQKLRIN